MACRWRADSAVLRLERKGVQGRLVLQRLDVVLLAVELGVHVQEDREESRRHLILEAPAERPRAGRVHVDRAHVRHEHFEGAADRDVEAAAVPAVVRHVHRLEQHLRDARERLDHRRVGPVHRNRGLVVVERGRQPERADRGGKAPPEMRQPGHEARSEHEVVCADLTRILALVQAGIRERLTIGVDELVEPQLVGHRGAGNLGLLTRTRLVQEAERQPDADQDHGDDRAGHQPGNPGPARRFRESFPQTVQEPQNPGGDEDPAVQPRAVEEAAEAELRAVLRYLLDLARRLQHPALCPTCSRPDRSPASW